MKTTIPILVSVVLLGCGKGSPEVVVYVALDREFAQPVLDRFTQVTGIVVRAKFDTESTKSVALRELITREASHPRCDVFWNNEVLNTIRLARANLLERHRPADADAYPAESRSADDAWHGLAGRARVLLINVDQMRDTPIPTSFEDLSLPAWRGRVGMAKPLFGTTATHIACLYAERGARNAKKLLERLRDNGLVILSGNKQAAVEVGAGRLAAALTDTDDALAEIRARRRVRIIYLPLSPSRPAPLVIPNTVALIKGCPHPEQGRRLIDFLLSAQTETVLAEGSGAQIPLRTSLRDRFPKEIPPMDDVLGFPFEKAADQWDGAMSDVKSTFAAP